ncbi:MAG: type II CAAX endopeptidase family protein [Candidatus Palauibacterales bacterium]|nr:type II CAAX endopeptidase family protein [Candidatus Palauibacterales bacterium]
MSPGDRRRRAVLVALGLALGGVGWGFVSAWTAPGLYDALLPAGSFARELVGSYVVQPGFAVLAGVYLVLREHPKRFVRLGRPSAEGLAWIALGPLLGAGAGWVGETLLGTSHAGGAPEWEAMLSAPWTIPLVLGVVFGVMAPMEELLYRGVIHGRLREAFGTWPVVLIGAALFGLMHVFLSGGLPSFVTTGLIGLGFGLAYERTDNLVVPIGMHGGIWLTAPL